MKKVYIIILISLMIITMNKIVLANDEITNLLQEQEETEENNLIQKGMGKVK